jgi:predicted Zn-dependent protease
MRPEDPMIWYRLAEVRGLAGNISGVHEARAEYFILVGAFGKAREQLGLAVKLVAADFKRSAIVRQRLRDVAAMEDRIEKL